MSLSDPTSGVGYAFGAKLPSTHMTTIATQQPRALDYVNGGTYTCVNALTTTNSSTLTQTFNGDVTKTYNQVSDNTYDDIVDRTYNAAFDATYNGTATSLLNGPLYFTLADTVNTSIISVASSVDVTVDIDGDVDMSGGAGTFKAKLSQLLLPINTNVTADANATLADGTFQRVKMSPTTTRTLTLPSKKAGSIFLLQVENNSGGGHAININSPAAVQVANVAANGKGGMLFVYTADSFPVCFLFAGTGVSTTFNPSI